MRVRAISKRLPQVARVVAGIVAGIGVMVLAGWAAGVPRMVHLFPHTVAMNPVTAATFILAGISLAQQAKQEHRNNWGPLLGAVVALLGALKLADFFDALPFHIDHLLFPARVQEGGPYPPNETAPNAALGFLLCGLGLLFRDRARRGIRLAQALVLMTGLIALLALIGYSYRALMVYPVRGSIPMAFETAVGFAVFGIGFLAARPEHGLMRLFLSPTSGGAVARRLLPMAVLIPWGLGALLLVGEQAGRIERDSAVSTFAVASIVIFTGLIWRNAKLLYLADAERARIEEQLREASANLQRSNTDLQQFANLASHDLMEPLRMVSSYLQLLRDRAADKLDPRATEFLSLALDGAGRMRALIHDLLEYSRVEVRGHALEPVECNEVLDSALSNLKVAIEEANAVIEREPLPKVRGDRVQLTQLFQNLIGNAIKFHGAEPPRIRVRAERRDNEWLFMVRDNGIGIEPQFYERIFVIFQRLHTRQEYSGTGMGLAICKKIVERHGGRIWVESASGKGSTFFFTLPVLDE